VTTNRPSSGRRDQVTVASWEERERSGPVDVRLAVRKKGKGDTAYYEEKRVKNVGYGKRSHSVKESIRKMGARQAL